MPNCNKCGIEFEVKKGLKNYCSISCRNSRGLRNEEVKKKISKGVKRYISENPEVHKRRINLLKKKRHNLGKQFKERIDWKCPVCDTILKLTEKEAAPRKYCSGTCRNIVNNKLITGTRSKAERKLEEALQKNNINYISNDRKLLKGKEVDFYFPDLNLAIEWNGIYHYKDVHGTLDKIQKSDRIKKEMLNELGIELIVIKDLTSSNKFINNTIKDIINYINRRPSLRKQQVSKTSHR